MNYYESIKYGFKNLFNYGGVTNKRDYRRFANLVLNVLFIVALAASAIFRYYPNDLGILSMFVAFGLLSYLPLAAFIAVILLLPATSRRLRDAGYSPKLQFLHLLPITPLGFLGYFSAINQIGWMVPAIALAVLFALGVWITLLVLTRRPTKSAQA